MWGLGGAVFEANCASCHGGAKWTKSQIFHRDNPAAVAQNGLPWTPASPGSRRRRWTTGERVLLVHLQRQTIKYLEDVGTFDITNPIEIRDNAAAGTAFGVNGFQLAVVAQHQLSRAVPAPWPSPDPG